MDHQDQLSQNLQQLNLVGQMTSASSTQNRSGQNVGGGQQVQNGGGTSVEGAVGGLGVSSSLSPMTSSSMAMVNGACGGSNPNANAAMFNQIFPVLHGYINQDSALACRAVCKDWKSSIDDALSGGNSSSNKK